MQSINELLPEETKIELQGFDETMFKKLPSFFYQLQEYYEQKQAKDMAIFSAIILLGGIMPKYVSNYFGEMNYANLYGFITAPFSAGKGIIKQMIKFVLPIHKAKKTKARALQLEYLNRKDNENHSENLKPPKLQHFISPDNTKINIIEILRDNNGRGTICDTEADTLANSIKGQHGQFSDILRKGYHYETVPASRKGDDLDIEVDNTCLTVLESGTAGQIPRLMGNAEDGLQSRFDFMQCDYPRFENPFKKDNELKYWIELHGEHLFLDLYDYLDQRKEELIFELTPQQEEAFYNTYSELDKNWDNFYSKNAKGYLFRQGLKTIRIAMVLALVRKYFEIKTLNNMPANIVCCDDDFECAFSISDTLMKNNIEMYEKLSIKPPAFSDNKINAQQQRLDFKNEVINLRKSGITSPQEICLMLGKPKSYRGAVARILKEAGF